MWLNDVGYHLFYEPSVKVWYGKETFNELETRDGGFNYLYTDTLKKKNRQK